MNRSRISLILFIVMALTLAACGGAPAAAPEAPAAPQPEAEAEAPETEAPETEAEVAEVQPEGCLGSAETAIVDLGCREVTIAVENAYLPFNYISIETGEPGGWDYDVWNEICARLHCTPVFVEAAWEGLIQAVSDGQYDVAADGITITPARAEIVDFSIGYLQIEQRLLVRAGEDRFASIEDLVADESLVIGTQSGTTNYETAVQYLPEDRIRAFEQFPFAVQALIAGDVDAVIIDEVAGMGYLGEQADALELVGPSISSDELGFVYPQGSELIEPVNLALQSMMTDGFLESVNARYFGPDFTLTYDDIVEVEY